MREDETRDAKRFPAVALELVMGAEELDELAPLRSRAPRAVVEPRVDGAPALRAVAHPRLLSTGGYNGPRPSGRGVSWCQASGHVPRRQLRLGDLPLGGGPIRSHRGGRRLL